MCVYLYIFLDIFYYFLECAAIFTGGRKRASYLQASTPSLSFKVRLREMYKQLKMTLDNENT